MRTPFAIGTAASRIADQARLHRRRFDFRYKFLFRRERLFCCFVSNQFNTGEQAAAPNIANVSMIIQVILAATSSNFLAH